jgi:hypothetical protein
VKFRPLLAGEGGGGPPIHDSRLFSETPLKRLNLSIPRNRAAGLLGGGAIALGFFSCPAALLFLVQDTQPLAMRVATLTIVALVFLLCGIEHCGWNAVPLGGLVL